MLHCNVLENDLQGRINILIVSFHMMSHVAFDCKTRIALVTFVRFFTSMSSRMHLKLISGSKQFATQIVTCQH